jgi:hypothetical protein
LPAPCRSLWRATDGVQHWLLGTVPQGFACASGRSDTGIFDVSQYEAAKQQTQPPSRAQHRHLSSISIEMGPSFRKTRNQAG